MSSKASIFGIVSDQAQADAIIAQLHALGFPLEDISALVADRGRVTAAGAEQAAASTATSNGGLLGGGIGMLVGLGALAIPGLGPFIAAGPIFAALSSAAVGAAVGGALGSLTGALVGAGIPESDAKHYEDRLREGAVLVAVQALEGDQMWRAKDVLITNGARDVTISGGPSAAALE